MKKDANILIVDDEQIVVEMTSSHLYHAGFVNLYGVHSGKEALKVFKEKEIDVVISDFIMPEMTGGEMFDIMKKEKPGLKFVFVSGYNTSELSEYSEQADVFLKKPFNLKIIESTILNL